MWVRRIIAVLIVFLTLAPRGYAAYADTTAVFNLEKQNTNRPLSADTKREGIRLSVGDKAALVILGTFLVIVTGLVVATVLIGPVDAPVRSIQ